MQRLFDGWASYCIGRTVYCYQKGLARRRWEVSLRVFKFKKKKKKMKKGKVFSSSLSILQLLFWLFERTLTGNKNKFTISPTERTEEEEEELCLLWTKLIRWILGNEHQYQPEAWGMSAKKLVGYTTTQYGTNTIQTYSQSWSPRGVGLSDDDDLHDFIRLTYWKPAQSTLSHPPTAATAAAFAVAAAKCALIYIS